MTQTMTRTETISRRFQAMRMRWPEHVMVFFQQEMLILAWPKMQPLINRRSKP